MLFFPTPPAARSKGREPMCLDKVWLAWLDAWMNAKPFTADRVGIAYMLAGDSGASAIDPYATTATAENKWVVDGPHLMIIVPNSAELEGFPTDPKNDGPYVMWKGTPYVHMIVPVGEPVSINPIRLQSARRASPIHILRGLWSFAGLFLYLADRVKTRCKGFRYSLRCDRIGHGTHSRSRPFSDAPFTGGS